MKNKFKLLISDMDSTLINIECVDEIADFAGLKSRVAAVTEAAMRGEIDFAESLRKRVKLLAGLPVEVLAKVYNERLKLNPGGEEMLAGLKDTGIKFALVSGGFTYFTRRLKAEYQIDYTRANMLGISAGKLDGTIKGEIIDGRQKQKFLLEVCRDMRISPDEVIALGDGANDLPMMKQAGLSLAYYAKAAVQRQTDIQINSGGLDRVLDCL